MRPSRTTSAQPMVWTSARQWALIALGALAFIVLSIPAATAQTAEGLCDDVLLQVSPTSISGDQEAVAITSQQFEADVPGWSQVSWEAAADTTLTGVIVRTEAESVTLTDGIATGTVEDALELTFCGSTAIATPDTDGTDGSDATDDDDGDTQVTQPVDDVCDDVLVTITPDSISGDETAVAITSQQLDADVVGWVSVSWEAAADTTLTGVTVRTVSGTATLIDDLQTGTVEDALELTFCGTTASDDAEDDGSDDEPTEVPEPETDGGAGGGTGTGAGTGSSGGGATGGGSTGGGEASTGGTGSGGTGGSSGGSTVPAPSDDDAEAPEPDPEPEPEPEPTPAPDAAEEPVEETDSDDAGTADTDDAESDDAESDDTEVLGVQLSQDDEGSGWVVPVLLILLVAGAIGAGFLVRNRYLATSGGR